MYRGERRRAQARLLVIGALYQAERPMMGYDLMKATGLNSGRVYATLAELQARGVVDRQQAERAIGGGDTAIIVWGLVE